MFLNIISLTEAVHIKYFNQDKINYLFKELRSEQNISIDLVNETNSANEIYVVALYHTQPLSNMNLSVELKHNPLQFTLFYHSPQLTIYYSNITINMTSIAERPFSTNLVAITESITNGNIIYGVFAIFSNNSKQVYGISQIIIAAITISNTRISQTASAEKAAGLSGTFYGTMMTLSNFSTMSVFNVTGNTSAVLVCFTEGDPKTFNLSNSTISGFITSSHVNKSTIQILVGNNTVSLRILLTDSVICIHGDTQFECGGAVSCDVQQNNAKSPDPLQYVNIQSFPYTDSAIKDYNFSFIGETGNNTDFEISQQVSDLFVGRSVSIFKQQKKFFNIKISGYQVELKTKEFSLFILDAEETIFKCITIYFQECKINNIASTIFMLQKEVKTSIIHRVTIDCKLQQSSQGRYVGLADKVLKDGSFHATVSTLIGNFYSSAPYSTLGLNQQIENATIVFDSYIVNIPHIVHSGFSSVIMNNISNVYSVTFQNTSFSIANTASSANQNGPIFGGFALNVTNSNFTVEKCNLITNVYFNMFSNSGTMIGTAYKSNVTLTDISLQGSNQYNSSPTNTGLIGLIDECYLFKLDLIKVATESIKFFISINGNGKDNGVIGGIKNSNISFTNSFLNIDIQAENCVQIGFIGSMVATVRGKNYKILLENIISKGDMFANGASGVLFGVAASYDKPNTNVFKNLQADFKVNTSKTELHVGMFGRINDTYVDIINTSVIFIHTASTSCSGACRMWVGGVLGRTDGETRLTFTIYTSIVTIVTPNGHSDAYRIGSFAAEMQCSNFDVIKTKCKNNQIMKLTNATLTMNMPTDFSAATAAGCLGVINNASFEIYDSSVTVNSGKQVNIVLGGLAADQIPGYPWSQYNNSLTIKNLKSNHPQWKCASRGNTGIKFVYNITGNNECNSAL